ncbi:cortical protein marker for cell polarity-domain-containing protein [Glomus cerebriforme]|uniref:Cortical protein marker for cell polarity-domain-containing protein n=1 Tax=Glomus cerebriforme TaxID=658196 RepID=A0A397TEX4_9GLOM|nr:cortical protein marker for cell polarity-domain-containing protein [Glomus cerebriforme]
MKIYSSLLTLLISCIGILQVSVSVTAEIPKLNFNALSQILAPGQYNGISTYSGAPGQREIFDNGSDSFITQSPDGTYQLTGTASSNGTINALCIIPRTNDEMDVYIGGNFSTLGGIMVNNIARYDPSARTFSPLIEGLDGPVYSLYCDTTNSIVYVGGIFAAPVNPAANNINATNFAGSVAIWRNKAWEALPFKGFNGPVYTIAYNEPNNTIYFGGQFDATGDGEFGEISNTQPINIQNAVITGGNSVDRVGFGDPNVIICSADPDGPGTTWLMRDNIPGFWRAEFSVKVTPSLIGIKNTNVEGRGTKAFRLIATADMSVITLSYMDPINGFTECSNSCPLSPDNVDFQMFTVINQPELIGIQIDILEWYGAGGGLHSIQLFQPDVIVRAANDFIPSCSVNQFQPKVIVEGNWTPVLISGIWKNVLQTSELATAKAILQPYIPQAGYYSVSMITPSCIPFDCSKTTSVDVTINAAPGQTFGPVTISQNNPTLNDKTDILFNVFITATTTFFQPTVEIKVSATVIAPAGAIITVDSIKFEKMYSSTPLRGLFQYWPPSNSNAQPAWNGFNGILAPLSTVHKIKVLSQSSIAIGGNFNNVTFFNIVEYDGTSFKPFPKGGLNGRVNTLEKVEDNLLVGGLFNNNVLESATIGLNNIAKLSLTERQWFPVSGGVNGEVERITLLNNQGTQQVHVAGKFNTVITPQANAEGIIFGNVTFGYAIWDDKYSNWATSGFVDGNIGDIVVSEGQAPLTFYAGRILSAQSTTAFGVSLLTSSGISALPFYPQALNGNIPETIINTGSLSNGNVIIGGKFVLDNNITNVAIMRDGLWDNLGNDIVVEEVKFLLVINESLYIGSASTVADNNTFNPFVIYDLNKRIVNASPQLIADDNNARVNIIISHTGTSDILVGGKFDKAGSLGCKTICAWDSNFKQWKTLGVTNNLSGEIFSMDLIGKKRDSLIAAGNLTLNGTPAYLLKYDFGKSSWEDVRGTGDGKLPGPAAVVSDDFTIDGQFFVSGYAEDGSVYLYKWIGNKFMNIGQNLLPGSRIEALSLLPSNSEHESVDYLDADWLLLVSGSLKLDSIGDISAALYDGKNMYPYLLSSQTSGIPGSILGIFTNISPDSLLKKHLPIPVVIAISTVIALSFVFLIFASGMSYRYFKRKRQAKELTPMGPRDSIKTPIRNSELMATINAATAIIGQQSNNRYSVTSSNNLRNSAIGSNVDVKSLDEAAASGFIGSGAIGAVAAGQQTSTLQNNPPTSIEVSEGATGQVLLNGEQAIAYCARYPFVAREDGELGFNAGDTIFVTDTSDEVWWLGWKRQNETDEFIRGVFPSNYVIDQMNQEEMPSSVS